MDKSRNLEDVSREQETDNDLSLERRRVPRLCLTSEQFKLSRNGKIFPIADLSGEGMAIRVLERNDFYLFPIGTLFEGTLNLRREKYPIKARVRHLGADLVGCQFSEDLHESSKKAIKEFLDPSALGQELRPIPATDGVAVWYHGPSGTDLLFWRHTDGQFSRLMFLILGTFVHWDETKGLMTGRLGSSKEHSEIRGVIRLETLLLESDPKPDTGKLDVAVTLITSSSIPEDLKKWCTRHLVSVTE